jgi:hypothetical protein
MEHTLVRLAETAGWFFLIVFIFAAIGLYATIRWIVGLFTKTEQAVEGGIGHLKERL